MLQVTMVSAVVKNFFCFSFVALYLHERAASAFSTKDLWSFGTARVSLLKLSSGPPAAADLHSEVPDRESRDKGQYQYHDLRTLTDEILDKDRWAAGAIPFYELGGILPLLLSWREAETPEGADTAERLIRRVEEERDAGNEMALLNSKHYTIAVDAWARSGHESSAENALRIIDKMKEQSRQNLDVVPTRVTYNALMQAYSRQGSTEKIKEILDFMEASSDFTPTTSDYNVLLDAFAKLGEPKKAEQALNRMILRCGDEGADCPWAPDLYSYNTLLDAWARSNEAGRGARVEEILAALEERVGNGEHTLQPDVRTYSVAINAIVNSNEQNTTERAEGILSRALKSGIGPDAYLYSSLLDAYATSPSAGAAQRAEELHQKLEEAGVANTVSYNTVLKAWKCSTRDDSPTRAEALLKRMKEKGMVDTFSYCTLIALYANLGGRDSAERAEEILQEMQDTGEVPNTETLNSVMHAWVRCGEVERAERILKKMEDSEFGRAPDVLPNVVSYTTVMNGWAKTTGEQGPEKTRETFQRMVSMYESGNAHARPNMFSYVTLINTVAKSGAPGSAAAAESILYSMYDEYQRGRTDLKPSTQLVTIVIDSWQKSGEREAGERAESLLNWLLEIYEKEGDDKLLPNEYTFGSAWARTRMFGKAARARSVLTKMVDLQKSGGIKARPNAHCYTAVINSCAYSEKDEIEKRAALQIAVETYKELADAEDGRPNQVFFQTIITAIRNLMPPCDKRAAAVATIFRRCAAEGEVAEVVVKRLQTALSNDQLKTLLGEKAVGNDGNIDLDQLPAGWRRNISGKKVGDRIKAQLS